MCSNSVSLSVPSDLKLSLGETTEDSITVSWEVTGTVNGYMINWSPGSSAAPEGTDSSYTITELEAGETYTISLTATNNAGSTTSTLTASTTDQGTESVNH